MDAAQITIYIRSAYVQSSKFLHADNEVSDQTAHISIIVAHSRSLL